MLRHLGYGGTTHSIDACTTRFCRPEEATPERVRSLVRDNLVDLGRILRFNAERGIGFYRVSSRIIPFGSHPANALPWWDEFGAQLQGLGQAAMVDGIRLEMHPGHHSLLNAPSPETVALSILELGWHVRLFESMGLDFSHKLAVRIGGTFGRKRESLDRFVTVIDGLPDSWRSRLIIENDGTQFDLADVLEASARTGLPVAYARQGASSAPDESRRVGACFASWKSGDGPPIVHLGSRTRRGCRPDWLDAGDLETLLSLAPAEVPFDCLLEAGQGDRALFEVRERMAVLDPARLDMAQDRNR